MPCMSLFTCHETLKYCVVVELLDITSSSNLKKKGRSHENANLYFFTFFWGGGGHDQTISLPKR